MESGQKLQLECECGTIIEASCDDELVRVTNAHTAEFHGMTLPAEAILAKARPAG